MVFKQRYAQIPTTFGKTHPYTPLKRGIARAGPFSVSDTLTSSVSLSGGPGAQRRLVLRMQVTAIAGSGVVLIAVVLIDPMAQ